MARLAPDSEELQQQRTTARSAEDTYSLESGIANVKRRDDQNLWNTCSDCVHHDQEVEGRRCSRVFSPGRNGNDMQTRSDNKMCCVAQLLRLEKKMRGTIRTEWDRYPFLVHPCLGSAIKLHLRCCTAQSLPGIKELLDSWLDEVTEVLRKVL